MKNYILFVLLFYSCTTYCQSIKSTTIIQRDIVNLIGNIESYDVFTGKQLVMNIIKVSNGYGSAHIPETDEVSHNIVISVSHYDDTPDYKVFTVGPFIFPKVIKKIDSGRSVIIIIEAGLELLHLDRQ
jgi:hypothetical protein